MSDRDTKASTKRLNDANGVSTLLSTIDEYTSTAELDRHTKLGTLFNVQSEIDSLKSNIQNSLIMGDTMFGTSGHTEISNEVKHRNDELKMKKATLKKDIHKKEKIVHTSNRDFSDIKDKGNESKIIFMEDFTILFLVISYLFMAFIAMYTFTFMSDDPVTGFFKSLLGFVIITIIVGMGMFNIL
jgi:chaperonin cofactor prefoldin